MNDADPWHVSNAHKTYDALCDFVHGASDLTPEAALALVQTRPVPYASRSPDHPHHPAWCSIGKHVPWDRLCGLVHLKYRLLKNKRARDPERSRGTSGNSGAARSLDT